MKTLSEQNIRKRFFCSICMQTSIFIFLILTCVSIHADSTNKVVLQLKWRHQFQFAGYYAALEKGYYSEAGLDVVLKEGGPDISTLDEVIDGRANYGIGMANIIVARQQGKPVVLLAAIFQHSPVALFLRRDSNVTSSADLKGKTIMTRSGNGDFEIYAMLLKESVKIKIEPRTMDLNRLLSGEIDGISGYITDMPQILKQKKFKYSVVNPCDYGIDFYGDCLFTSEKEIKEHPKRVAKFLKASLKGWRYAMDHPVEISDLIHKKYSSVKSKDQLLYEAEIMRNLMNPDILEIGHINPYRLKHIADILAELKVIPGNYSLDGLLYAPEQNASNEIKKLLYYALVSVSILILIGVALTLFNRKLKKMVDIRTQELNNEKLFSDALIEALPGSFFVYEDGERLIRWNKTAKQVSGYTDRELLGMHPLDWFTGEEKEKAANVLHSLFENGYAECESEIFYKKTGKTVPYYHRGVILKMNGKKYVVGIRLDLTEKKQLEAQFIQAQKMESIGRFAGGIAHDFNNILTTILGYSELLLIQMEKDDPIHQKISLINDAGTKASALTKQLLAFSRKQILKKQTVSINSIINNFLKLLSRIVGEGIVIKTYLEAKNGIIDADPGQIEQILMNLVVNAKDAIPDNGEIIFETADTVFDEDSPGSHLNLKPGRYIMLAVTDNGKGMDQEVLKHIFDPFFTTKERGQGTGLGLATVYGIVKQHDGYIYTYSEEHKGTTFKIYFPVSTKSVNMDETDTQPASISTGNEKILVVDDESSICQLIFDILEPLGYKCLIASDGNEALKLAHEHNNIDLLLTDVVMPGINGRILSEKLLAEKPDLKVLFMSGYTENVITHNGILDTSVNYIPKPVTPVALTQKIRSVLDS